MPKPSLGDLSDLKSLSVRQRRENNPNVLGYNYDELVSLDTVDVELVPEKKGILLKHNEYHVSSKVRPNNKKIYNQSCIKGHCISWSPCIKQSVVKVPSVFPLNHCNFSCVSL